MANYWREKIKSEARSRVKGNWLPLRYIFSEKDMEYYKEFMRKTVKAEQISIVKNMKITMLSKLLKMANFAIDIRPQQNWTIKSFESFGAYWF